MNRVILIGRVGQETQNTNGVVKFSLATDESYKDKQGQKVSKTAWHSCVAFGKSGETISKYVKKGDLFAFEGKIDYNEHEGKKYTSIIVESFNLIANKPVVDAQHIP